jgi:acetate kinase
VLKDLDGSAVGMRILVINAGSTSVKLSLVDEEEKVLSSKRLEPADEGLVGHLREFLKDAGPVNIVGHRIVHGGPKFTTATEVTRDVRKVLVGLNELAPLHNPPGLAGIDAVQQLIPDVPQVACFDTSFHVTLPSEARTYAIPSEWITKWGIRRYGFHGISCSWAAPRAAEILARPTEGLRLVICHLGGGASATAVLTGKSVDTTMGFTPVEGLVMATRPGDLDPGALLWALSHGLSVAEASNALELGSGLFGLSGRRSSDSRELLIARDSGDKLAKLAIAVYLHRLRAKIAAMVAATSGIDALVFTGGIGENSAVIRGEACANMKWLGIEIDDHANQLVGAADADISNVAAQVRTLVIHSREDLQIARECRQLYSGSDK